MMEEKSRHPGELIVPLIWGLNRRPLLLCLFLILSVLLPDFLNGASPNDKNLISNQPSLPEWLLPEEVSAEQYEANPFSPKLYRFWQEKDVRQTQQKLQQLIRTEHELGVRQHIRIKYKQGTQIAKKCSIARCSP